MIRATLTIGMILALLAGCTPDAKRIAADANLMRSEIPAGDFTLVAYTRITEPGAPLNVYIEGDGRAWLSPHLLSDDPTPRRAIGLQLAAADPGPNVIYLARPCQFVDLKARPCDKAYWSGKRYSEEVIRAVGLAVDHFISQSGSSQVNLVGYSGGGAVAVLLAARRSNVASLRTVAGNLAVERVNRLHDVDAMPDSLDPIDFASALRDLPQIHFTGTDDTVIPEAIADAFAERAGNSPCVRIVVVDGARHEEPWPKRWPELLALQPVCR